MLSSAILYAAIIAIWALVLLPRWLRRGQPATGQDEAGLTEAGPVPAGDAVAEGAGDAVAEGAGDAAPPATHVPAGHLRAQRAPGGGGTDGAEGRAPTARPAASEQRTRILKARRRTLSAVVALTVAAAAMVGAHLAANWVLAPPVAMLAGLLLLLREAARTDAQRARDASRPDTSARDAAAREASRPDSAGRAGYAQTIPADSPHAPAPEYGLRGEEDAGSARAGTARGSAAGLPPAHLAGPALSAGPGSAGPGLAQGDAETRAVAQIIDISARIDQVYDQYADAAVRAVGD